MNLLLGSLRQKEIGKDYLTQLDKHIADLKAEKQKVFLKIKDLADLLHFYPSNTILQVLGQSSCDLYEQRLVVISKNIRANQYRQ